MHIRRVVPLLHVHDIAASLDFYRDAFGAQVISSWPAVGSPRWAYIRAGSLALMIYQPRDGVDRADAGRNGLICYLTVDDADASYKDLKANGFEVSEPKDHSYGVREFYLADPDGNRFALGHGIPVHA